MTWWWGHYTLQRRFRDGLTTLPHSLLSQDVSCTVGFRKPVPQEKFCCQKIRWARKAGNWTGLFCRLKGTRHILPASPHQNCQFGGVLSCCNKWWPPYQARCKVAVRVILKCWWLLSTWRSAVRGLVLRPKRDTEEIQFCRDFIENIRQDIAACLSQQAILLNMQYIHESNDTLLKYLYRWPENSTSLFRKSTEFTITSRQLLQNCNYTHSHEWVQELQSSWIW